MDIHLERFIVPALIFLLCTGGAFVVRSIAFRALHRWARSTATQVDDILIAALRTPSIFWVLALGAEATIQFSGFHHESLAVIHKTIAVLLILSATLAAANLAGRMLRSYIQQRNMPLPATGLAYGVLKGIIMVIGLLMILGVLGISVAPLLTALGVGGLAVALALQDTLANLFAGIHVLVEKSVRVGDFIKLESGQEGYVDDITWRTTRVRMLPNNMVVIPNSKLAQSVVTNYYLPEKRMSLLIPVSVSYDADPERVEKLLVEEAVKGARDIPGLLADPAPFVRFIPGFGDSSLDFTLICQVVEFTDQYLAQHELRKRIFKRFREEGIEIPFPQRTVHLRNGQVARP
jgi:small-conductance mechanosensitive channel